MTLSYKTRRGGEHHLVLSRKPNSHPLKNSKDREEFHPARGEGRRKMNICSQKRNSSMRERKERRQHLLLGGRNLDRTQCGDRSNGLSRGGGGGGGRGGKVNLS